MRNETRLESLEALAKTVAASIREDLLSAIELQGQGTLVLPGGLPELLLEALGDQDLPWARITVTLTDELWVAAEEDGSHERQLRESLLSGGAGASRFVPLKIDQTSPEAAQEAVAARLEALFPFDVVVLTLGRGGSVASLIAGAPEIEAAVDLESSQSVLGVNPPGAPHPRLSLTLAALLYSLQRYLILAGEDEWSLYQAALEDGPVEELPLRGLLHPHSRAISVLWAP